MTARPTSRTSIAWRLQASRSAAPRRRSVPPPLSGATRWRRFLARAIPLTAGAGDDYFRDDDGTTHEADIDRAAAAGITTGCGTWRYCIDAGVTRGQMAGFLHRVVEPIAPPPHPAPSGISILHVATSGSDSGNACLVETSPCRTIARALDVAFDGDTISIGPGTFNEENLAITHDLTIEGDPDGGTTIDASGGDRYRIFTIPPVKSPRNSSASPSSDPRRIVALARLTMTGGRAGAGGAIENDGTLTITDSTISGNTSYATGAIYNNNGTLTITNSTISGNTSYVTGRGGGIASYYGTLTITNSTISGNTASRGGGISFTYDGIVTITNSTISGNTATTGDGGGIRHDRRPPPGKHDRRRQRERDRRPDLGRDHEPAREHRGDPDGPDPGRHPRSGRPRGSSVVRRRRSL